MVLCSTSSDKLTVLRPMLPMTVDQSVCEFQLPIDPRNAGVKTRAQSD